MPKPIGLLDFDNVIRYSLRGYVRELNRRFNARYSLRGVKSHDYKRLNIELAHFKEVIDDHDWFIEALIRAPGVPGYLNGLRELQKGYELHIATAQIERYIPATEKWLEVRGLSLPIHLATPAVPGKDKTERSKEMIARAIGAKFVVDDNHHEFENWESSNIDPICFRHGWNLSLAQTNPEVPRYRWDEIPSYALSRL